MKKRRGKREIQGRKERETKVRGRQGGIEERADRKKMNEKRK